jgi:hypothetical protein
MFRPMNSLSSFSLDNKSGSSCSGAATSGADTLLAGGAATRAAGGAATALAASSKALQRALNARLMASIPFMQSDGIRRWEGHAFVSGGLPFHQQASVCCFGCLAPAVISGSDGWVSGLLAAEVKAGNCSSFGNHSRARRKQPSRNSSGVLGKLANRCHSYPGFWISC